MLALVGHARVEHVEAVVGEETAERRRREVGAVLVHHVVELPLAQDEARLGHLDEDDGVGPVADGAAEHVREGPHVGNVLHRHLAAVEVRVHVGPGLGVEVLHEAQAQTGLAREPLAAHRGIEADALHVAQAAQQVQELALSAAHLQHPPPPEPVSLDQVAGELPVIDVEGGREGLVPS